MPRRFFASTFLVGLALLSPIGAQERVEIRNWSAPPLWSPPRLAQPDRSEVETGSLEPQGALEGTGLTLPTAPFPFIAIQPCRIADTRGNGFTGQAGPPTLPGFTTRVFQVDQIVPGVPTQCGIPIQAEAVSFQFTVTNMAAAGNLIAWPEGPPPTVSVLNWNANSVAIGSGTIVALDGQGTISVRINGPGADLIIDVNGYYGPSLNLSFVNEGQVNSITSAMITDGEIVNADIAASAAIADTKLATIVTAGKVADSALSASVTKLGPTIEASEITNVVRSVLLPLTSFTDCGAATGALIDFSDASGDAIPHFAKSIAEGAEPEIRFDGTGGSPDQNYEICSQFIVPSDYASGGSFRVSARLTSVAVGATEALTCVAKVNNVAPDAAGSVPITTVSYAFYTCTPTMTLAAGDFVSLIVSITSPGVMDNHVGLRALEFRYIASQ